MGAYSPETYVSFDNPPVVEVVAGTMFRPLERFMAPHVGIFWQQIREKFANVDQAARFSSGTAHDFAGPMPRVWLLSDDETRLIQLQENIFFYNWRRRESDPDYPRYSAIEAEFFEYLERFERFIHQEHIGTIEEIKPHLAYINHIERNAGWSDIEEVSRVFPFLDWTKKEVLGSPTGFMWRGSFIFENGTLEAIIGRGERHTDQQEILSLELRATTEGEFETKDDLKNWLREAHKWITKGFVELTTNEIQVNQWKRN